MLKVQLQSTHPVHLELAFECREGELLALVGPSGSGKTSALRAIAGLLPVQQGVIQIGSQCWLDSTKNINITATKRSVGMVFQNYALFPHLTAFENIRLALPEQMADSYIHDLIRDMGLTDLQQRFPHELSGGQRQRVALARAFARQPEVLLLDEAFSAVDHPTRKILYEELVKLRQRIKIPIVMVTHDLREASLLSDQMCILDQGKTLQQASPRHIFSSPRNERVAQLVGLMDIYSGTFFKSEKVDGQNKSLARLQWGRGVQSIFLEILDKGRLPDQTEVRWVISSAYVQLSKIKPSLTNTFSGTVNRILQLGDISTITINLDLPFQESMHLEISAREVKDLQLQEGQIIYVSLDPAGIHIMPVYSNPQIKMAQKRLRERPIQIGAILLLAGQGSRLGNIPKCLMKIDNKSLLDRHIEALQDFVTQPIVAVTGYYSQLIQQQGSLANVCWVHNSEPELGQRLSVRLGLEALYKANNHLDLVLMMLGDQPYMESADIRQLIENFKVMKSGQFLVPLVDGKRGNPVLLSGTALQEIIESSPDMTVRQYMDMHPGEVTKWESSNDHIIFDIDTHQDLIDFQMKTGKVIELPVIQKD